MDHLPERVSQWHVPITPLGVLHMFRAIYNFFNANIHFFFHISIKIIGKLFNILTILQLYTPFRAFLLHN